MLPVVLNERAEQIWGNPYRLKHPSLEVMVDRLFNPDASMDGRVQYPVDVREDQDNVYVEAELPGFRAENIDITLDIGLLSVQAKRNLGKEHDSYQHVTERGRSEYVRQFSLPMVADDAEVTARLLEGVLYLTLPKKEEIKPRRIPLK